jgi:2-oxoglutarate ferredoxin oxidoreductase subunit alpha
MAWGAAATGTPSATGSTGQGLSLMQESFSEITLAELPLVIFNMARGQQDYFQTTRGGGWGDYRTIALAPASVVEAAEHTRLAFELADRWLTPVVLYGDHMIGFTQTTVEAEPARDGATGPDKPWALDGSSGGTGASKVVWTWRQGKHNTPGPGPNRHWQHVADKYDQIAATEARHAGRHVDDAEHVVVSFGTTGAFVDYVVDELRREGHRIGTFRPVTLWPFPSAALGDLARSASCRQVLVHELNAGQMIDDVRIAVNGAVPVHAVGGVSQDESGMRQGELLDVDTIRARILAATEGARP